MATVTTDTLPKISATLAQHEAYYSEIDGSDNENSLITPAAGVERGIMC